MYLAIFHYYTKLVAKRVELVQLMHKFVPWNRIGIFRNERTRSTPSTLNWHFGVFRTIWEHSGPFDCLTKLGAKGLNWCNYCTSSCHEIASEFFAMNGPDPPHWTIKSCFGAFHSVWVHLAMFHYYTKLVTKWVELVQLMHKFVPWSRFRIFRNERTQSTPLDPKLMFVCIS